VLGVVAATLARHSPGVADAIRSAPFLSAFPKSLDPSPWPDTRRYRRFLPAHEPLPDWWPHDVRPLVYVTFGSVVGGLPEAGAVYRAALQAAGTLPVRVLLTVGSTFDPATLGPIPANAHVEPWVAQEDVLAEAALVICHGGSGTVLGALASGVPLVVCPLFADQSANAGMVQDAGAGVVVTSKRPAPGGVAAFGEDDVPSLRRAVTDTLADKLTARAVRQIAAEIARTPALGDVLVPPTRPDAGWIGVR
jgi:MGT family glycosyltransferase